MTEHSPGPDTAFDFSSYHLLLGKCLQQEVGRERDFAVLVIHAEQGVLSFLSLSLAYLTWIPSRFSKGWRAVSLSLREWEELISLSIYVEKLQCLGFLLVATHIYLFIYFTIFSLINLAFSTNKTTETGIWNTMMFSLLVRFSYKWTNHLPLSLCTQPISEQNSLG